MSAKIKGFFVFRACEKVKIRFFKLTFSQNWAARRIKAFPLISCNVGSVFRAFYWFKNLNDSNFCIFLLIVSKFFTPP